ncbi:hypothetical protein, partial [Kitasatospora sp. NPDC097643]|uniref:hypothetical protein n=1 Tax=Kitasatospora sp. NPDC097643 TaxID=3157230 RepID=UPI003322F70A
MTCPDRPWASSCPGRDPGPGRDGRTRRPGAALDTFRRESRATGAALHYAVLHPGPATGSPHT